jgi:hypothetical protein
VFEPEPEPEPEPFEAPISSPCGTTEDKAEKPAAEHKEPEAERSPTTAPFSEVKTVQVDAEPAAATFVTEEKLPAPSVASTSVVEPIIIESKPATAQVQPKGQRGKGKERVVQRRDMEETSDKEDDEEEEEGDEYSGLFFESMTTLPWDDAPFKQAYAQHKVELNGIVVSLKESLARLEQSAQANAQRLTSIERSIQLIERRSETSVNRDTRSQAAPHESSGVTLRDLSWSTIAVAVAWPVVAIAVYHRLANSNRHKTPK